MAEMDSVMFENHLEYCDAHPELSTGLEIIIYSVSS